MLIMSYQVKNKTRRPLYIKVEDYQIEDCLFSNTADTILLLPPKASITLGSATGLGFPWDTKKLFRLQPGMHNFNLLDTNIVVDYSDRNWRYRRGSAVFMIKKRQVERKKEDL
jgi:hypothetical protein